MSVDNVHVDILKRPINIGDYVSCGAKYYYENKLVVGEVIDLTPKMVRVKVLVGNCSNSTVLKQPDQVILIDNTKYVTMAMLK